MADRETIDVYNAKAEEYAERFGSVRVDPTLAAFIKAMPEGGHVLDLGCGPGFSAAAMVKNGLRVTATDASPAMVDMATAHPGVDARCATFDDIAGEEIYDGVWANCSLLHAQRSDLPRHLHSLSQAMKVGGFMHVAMKTGVGEARDSIGRHYVYVTEHELDALLRDAGLTPISRTTGEEPGLDGTMAAWVAMLAQKSTDD